jgi:hypothetical protein
MQSSDIVRAFPFAGVLTERGAAERGSKRPARLPHLARGCAGDREGWTDADRGTLVHAIDKASPIYLSDVLITV